jgi:phosphatidylserine decarboxylase
MSFFAKYQPYAPLKFSTWCFGTLAKIKFPWLKNYFIRKFIRKYQVNMDEALQPDINAYATFNDFFSRRLKPGARIWAPLPALPSPVDGFISQMGPIHDQTLVQAKGLDYTVSELLLDEALSERFQNGDFSTLYLSPKDYHRVHMPMDGNLTSMTFVPGRVYSVNPETVDHHPKLFARNERLICHFETSRGPMVIVLVGALNVASMFTAWESKPIKFSSVKNIPYHPPKPFKRGEEMGGFLMGSTAILLFAQGMIEWDAGLKPLDQIKMGERLGEICA